MLRQHGRKSQHAVMMSGVTDVNWPPEPPENISAQAQLEWRAVTRNLPADAMPRECLSLLAVWCAVKTELDDVMLALTRDHDPRLVRMRSALAREFGQLSSRLRLTPQQRLDAHRGPRADNVRPWSTKRASAGEQEAAPQQRLASTNGTPWSATGEIESED
jgi:phage terminase small subunit